MDKEKILKTLQRASKLNKGKEIALAQEFQSIEENIQNIDNKVSDISNSVSEKIDSLSEELKKKLEQELVLDLSEDELKENIEKSIEDTLSQKLETAIETERAVNTQIVEEKISTSESKIVSKINETAGKLRKELSAIIPEGRMPSSIEESIKNVKLSLTENLTEEFDKKVEEAIKNIKLPESKDYSKDIADLRNTVALVGTKNYTPAGIEIFHNGRNYGRIPSINFKNGNIEVSASRVDVDLGSGTGGSSVWGGITGTLSDQTDLQNALNAKQDTLVSGTNIKTINGTSLLGSGDISVSGSVSDGDKGDITVSSSGTVWNINAGVVTETELNASVNASLDLADSAVQPTALASYVPYTGATSDLNLGAQKLIVKEITTPIGLGDSLSIIADDALTLDGVSVLLRGSSTLGLSNNSGSTIAYFDTTSQTADRTFTLPDADGTIALTSDIPSTLSLQTNSVDNGSQSLLNLIAGSNITLTDDGLGGITIDATGGGSSYTFSTGLTESAGTVTANLSTGVAGGQSVIGGTNASNNLTLSSTSNATKGKVIIGTGFAYHENTQRLTVGTTTDYGYTLGVAGTLNAQQSVLFATNSGNVTFGSTSNTGQVVFSVKQSTNTGLGWAFGYDSFNSNGFYIYSNETTANPNFNIYAGTARLLTAYGTGTSGVVINENGADKDFRVEGDTNANLIFADASVDRVAIGHGTPDRLFHVELADAVTNAVSYPFRVTHTSSGTVATNFGVGQEFELENASNTNRIAGTFEFQYTDATNATEDASYKLRLIKAGTLTDALTVDSVGNGTFAGVVKTAGYTVATLPTGVVGYRAYVTDALTPTFGATVVGGGAVTIPVFYDGTNWIVG